MKIDFKLFFTDFKFNGMDVANRINVIPIQMEENECVPPEHLHCLNCFRLDCKLNNQLCPQISCLHCGARLHQCKLRDHIENICSRAPSPCYNAAYGCTVQLRRQLLPRHLAHCPASIVHCPFIRNRQFISEKAKKHFKRMAKGRSEQDGSEPENLDDEELLVPDVAFARIDQTILKHFFQCSREWRRRLLPSAIPADCLAIGISASDKNEELGDSSDEERRIIERNHQKIREPFAGCRLCRMNPGSQHLHQLGSLRAMSSLSEEAEDQQHQNGTKSDESVKQGAEEFLPEFYRQRGLLVCFFLIIDFFRQIRPEISFMGIVVDEQYLHSNYPIFGCHARFVRRDHFHAHYAAHLALEEAAPAAFDARCPNWQYGCAFRTTVRKAVNGGMLRFNPFHGACVHEPLPQLPVQSRWPSPTSTGLSLDQMPATFFTLLGPYLEDASLRVLASTCRRMREMLRMLLANRLAVEILWRRKDGEDGENNGGFEAVGVRKWFAPVQSSTPQLIVEPQGPIIDHLQQCPFKQVHDLGNERIDLRKIHGSHFPFPDSNEEQRRNSATLFGILNSQL